MAFPAAPADGDQHTEGAITYQYSTADLAWIKIDPEGTVTRENITGAATLDVTGHTAAELTLTGDVTSLAFTGWDTDTSLYQKVRVQLVQDATGGHAFDWTAVTGDWRETPPAALATTPASTILEFYAITTDGGASVFLEPVGLEYLYECPIVSAEQIDVPAVTGGGEIVISHSFAVLASVELVNQTTGVVSRPSYTRTTPAEPSSPVSLSFVAAHGAGDYKAVLSGLTYGSCDLVVRSEEWITIPLALTGATSITPQVGWLGSAGEVQFVPGDGSAPINVSGAGTGTLGDAAHTYGAAFTGVSYLRYKRGNTITRLDFRNDPFTFDLSELASIAPSLTGLNLSNTDVVGNIAALATATSLTDLRLDRTAVTGDISAIAPLSALSSVYLWNTSLGGDVSVFADKANISTVWLYNTNISGDVAAFADKASLSNLYLYNTDIGGDVAGLVNLPAITDLRLHNNQITGNAPTALSGFTTLTRLYPPDFGSGDIAGFAPLTSLTLFIADLPNSGTNSMFGDPLPFVTAAAGLTNFTYTRPATPPSQAELDAVLGQFDTGGVLGNNITVGAGMPNITNTVAVDNLRAKGWTVTTANY